MINHDELYTHRENSNFIKIKNKTYYNMLYQILKSIVFKN